jgi:hypothetical protein
MLLTIYSHFCSVLTLGAFSRNPQQPILKLPAAAAIYGDEMKLDAGRINLASSVSLFTMEGLIVSRASRRANSL